MRELPPSETGVHTDAWVAEHFPPTDRIAPELAPGDALIFDHLTLHRTQPLDREMVSRMSIECRVTRHPGYLTLVQALHGCRASRLPSLEVLEPSRIFNDVFPGTPHFEEKRA
jgi:hypothetical protein